MNLGPTHIRNAMGSITRQATTQFFDIPGSMTSSVNDEKRETDIVESFTLIILPCSAEIFKAAAIGWLMRKRVFHCGDVDIQVELFLHRSVYSPQS